MDAVNTGPIDHLLRTLWEHKGSDLLLVAGAAPTVRIDGELRPIGGQEPLTAEGADSLILSVLGQELGARLRDQREIDFSFGWEWQARFRGNAFHQRGSIGLALRLIPREIPTFEQLGLPSAIEQLAAAPQGLVLVTGPTGSGKSTTLASIIRHIADRRACHILTIEDPIEYAHSHGRAIVTQREIGTDSESFAKALRSALREDPDVLLVGEMRDTVSIETALTISETGHLVFATLHTNDTSQAIDRIIDVFPAERQSQIRVQFAATLLGVVAQRLVPKIGGGRVAAFELLLANTAVRSLIREGKTEQIRNSIATGQRSGMQTLEMSLTDLVVAGVIEHDAAVAVSSNPRELGVATGVPRDAALGG
ncbi:MAG: type IV pilus twitching motility protein PilT [Acidimicrobiia bacterium]